VPTVNPEDHDTTRFHSFLIRTTFSKSKTDAKLNYQLGFDLNSEIGIGKRILDGRQQMGDYAMFVSTQYQPWKFFSLQPGIRFIYNTKYPAPLVYSINLKFSWHDHYNVRASYSRGFRAPSLKELYLYFVDVNHNVQGNPDLESENSHNVNFSFQYFRETLKSYISAEINLFYNNINNSIDLAQASGDLYTYINVTKKITQGAQAIVNYRLYPWLNFRTGAGVTGKHNSLDVEQGATKDFYYSPDAMANVTYKWMKPEIDFALNYKFTGKMPQFYINEEGNPEEGYVSHFNTMDFSVQRSFFRNRLSVGAGVKNIFDNTDIPAVGGSSEAHTGGAGDYPVGWGRTFFIQASVNINQF
jgi:outer membrane receptor for ferrienterochelin and colicins